MDRGEIRDWSITHTMQLTDNRVYTYIYTYLFTLQESALWEDYLQARRFLTILRQVQPLLEDWLESEIKDILENVGGMSPKSLEYKERYTIL